MISRTTERGGTTGRPGVVQWPTSGRGCLSDSCCANDCAARLPPFLYERVTDRGLPRTREVDPVLAGRPAPGQEPVHKIDQLPASRVSR